jgi:hypothetical protein
MLVSPQGNLAETISLMYDQIKLHPEMTKIDALSMLRVHNEDTGDLEIDPEAQEIIDKLKAKPKERKKQKKRKKETSMIPVYTSLEDAQAGKPAVVLDMNQLDPDKPVAHVINAALDAVGK